MYICSNHNICIYIYICGKCTCTLSYAYYIVIDNACGASPATPCFDASKLKTSSSTFFGDHSFII